MAFKDREEYEKWANSPFRELNEGTKVKDMLPNCESCNIGDVIVLYENSPHSVRKACKLCLGLKKKNIKSRPKPKKYKAKKVIKKKKSEIIKKQNKPKKERISKYSIGKEFKIKYGTIKIVEKGSKKHTRIIEFQDEYKIRKEVGIANILIGEIKNPYFPSIYNRGFLGIGKHEATKGQKMTEAYSDWNEMLRRSYSDKMHERRPTYKEVEVCEEWHNFQKFADWAENTGYLYKKWHLDKDLILKGNKLYSPETCVYIPKSINSLLIRLDDIENKTKKSIKQTQKRIKEVMEEYEKELDEKTYKILIDRFNPILNIKI